MADRHEIRKAHEIVDRIPPRHEREAVRKLLPPRPEVTFGEAIQALRGRASEDDIHLWEIIGHLERFEKSYRLLPLRESESLSLEDAPEGSVAAEDGSNIILVKGSRMWRPVGMGMEFGVERMESLRFKILRWGWGDD